MSDALITSKRKEFHLGLLNKEILTRCSPSKELEKKFKNHEVPPIVSNADIGSINSIILSQKVAEKVEASCLGKLKTVKKKKDGNSLGKLFEQACCDYIKSTFLHLKHLRPGEWEAARVAQDTGKRKPAEPSLGNYEQYSHLKELASQSKKNRELRAFLGDGYTIIPDVVITRRPEPDITINEPENIVDMYSALKSPLREINQNPVHPLLHASLSCKFTMRSDRAQNSRTEGLNLIRSRKGRTPHIVVITAETSPTRLASLALGTGDLDCVYHFALYELKAAIEELEGVDTTSWELLNTMIDGKRLKDISDLPLDLAV